MISSNILLFRVNTLRIKHQEMSWFNHKPIKHPKEPLTPYLTSHRLSPATVRIMEVTKKKVRPKNKKS
jgi:hypothetical protein